MSVQDAVIDIIGANAAVEDYSVGGDTIKIWAGTRAHDAEKQALADDITAVEGVELIDKGVQNDWRVFVVQIS